MVGSLEVEFSAGNVGRVLREDVQLADGDAAAKELPPPPRLVWVSDFASGKRSHAVWHNFKPI